MSLAKKKHFYRLKDQSDFIHKPYEAECETPEITK
jgi:hypothetical protein